jgi:putative FmdB family regulatory protein
MPRYDYACSSCGHAAEEVHSIHLDSLTICPKCQKPDYSKQIVARSRPTSASSTPPSRCTPSPLTMMTRSRSSRCRAPDVDVATDPRDEMYGIPIARSRKQKLQALKAMEFTELN